MLPLKDIEIVKYVPKHCGHDSMSAYDLYLTPDVNDLEHPDAVWVEPASAEKRAIMRGHLPYGYEGAWKVLQICRLCIAMRGREWKDLHWHMSPYERQIRFVRLLSEYEPKGEKTLTQEDQEFIIHLTTALELTRYDFKLIDEQPYNYHVENWHWKLRQVRNSLTNTLFDVLKQNEEAGTGDDYCVPKMPLRYLMRD